MGGLSPQHTRWCIHFFLLAKVLGEVLRGKFIDGLRRLYRRKQLRCEGPLSLLADPKQFARLFRRLHRHDWVTYAKPALGGPLQVLRYFQSPPGFLRRRTRHLLLERLRPRLQAEEHHSHRHRVPTPLLPAWAAQGLRAHPLLRLPGQSTADPDAHA